MWRDTLRDLEWRRRRFIVAVVGTALVFAVTLLIGGLADSFRAEARHSVEALGIDQWVAKKGTVGPSTGVSLIDAGLADQITHDAGVRRADPILVLPEPIQPSKFQSSQVWGVAVGGLGTPPVTKGRALRSAGEAVVNDTLGPRIGDHVVIAALRFTVVGETHGLTLYGGQPNVYVTIGDLQRMSFNGLPLATAIGVRGHLAQVPPGAHLVTPDELRIDLLEPVKNAIGAIDTIRVLLWIVAGSIIGAVVYLSALERLRDFAVFKATGVSTSTIFAGLMLEAGLLSVVSAAIAAGLARALEPAFPLSVVVSTVTELELVGIAVVIGGLASLVAVRRATSVDPAIAFGGP